MRSSKHSFHTGIAVALATTFLLTMPSAPANAHEESHTLAALKMVLTDPAGKTDRRKFLFKTKKQFSIYDVSTDLSQVVSNLSVSGTGESDGRSGVIRLDPDNWKRIGKAAAPKGWKYKADWRYSNSLGVNKVLIKKGSDGGKLLVKAKGKFWPYWIADAQGTVELSLLLGGEQYCAEVSADNADLKKNEAGKFVAKGASPPAECSSVCGNGKLELGETCDDGNDEDTDTCTNTCETGCTSEYTSTFEAIQELIFDSPSYQCSNDICHGATTQSGGLDLRAGLSYDQLINVSSSIDPDVLRVFPGDQGISMLYNKIAEKTLGSPDVAGTSMPANATTVDADLLEAMDLWIRGGAPGQGVVDGTAALLDACLPPPSPNKMPRPDPPAADVGMQMAMPGWELWNQSENEVCVASYYDLSAPGLVPDSAVVDCPGLAPGTNDQGSNAGKCFAFGGQVLQMDAQSHHVIIHIYTGENNTDDPGWGTWRCYGGDDDGLACDPKATGVCPGNGVCGSNVVAGLGCAGGFGPEDVQNSPAVFPTFGGAQESTNINLYPDGVYATLPLKGIVIWNSHGFNLTGQDMQVEGWNTLLYNHVQQYRLRGMFGAKNIFTQQVPPFESREYCSTETLPVGTSMFSLTSHTHRHGKRWRYYAPPQAPCANGGLFQADPNCLPGDPSDIFYESFSYNDPLTITYDPPWVMGPSVQDRTLKYCSLYDNGQANPAEVKRRSTSPMPPSGIASALNIGGPCAWDQTYCLGGPNQGTLCFAEDTNCPEGVCDACELEGGLRTEDEMFLPLGSYYTTP